MTTYKDQMRQQEDRKSVQQMRRANEPWRRKNRHSSRSNLRYARRPKGWQEWIAAVLLRRTFFDRTKVIPVHLRPHVPHVRHALDNGEGGRILAEAKRLLPKAQFKHVYAAWL